MRPTFLIDGWVDGISGKDEGFAMLILASTTVSVFE
mgnify:CR=1 FL=1